MIDKFIIDYLNGKCGEKLLYTYSVVRYTISGNDVHVTIDYDPDDPYFSHKEEFCIDLLELMAFTYNKVLKNAS